MNKIIIGIVVLLVLGVGAYYFINNNGSQTPTSYTSPIAPADNSSVPTPAPTPVQPTTTAVTPVTAQPQPASTSVLVPPVKNLSVSISNFSFAPAVLTAKVGTKVTWVNNDSVTHTVTSDSGSLLNSQDIAPGASFSFTFTNVGTTNYHCNIHPSMKGSIVITM